MTKRRIFECPKCRQIYEVSFWKWLWAMHLFDIWRYMRCPNCNKFGWARRKKD